MNADKRRSAFIRVNPRPSFMVSCLCLYQDYQDYRAPVSAAVASAAVPSAVAVVLALRRVHPVPEGHVRFAAGVRVVVVAAIALHVVPDRDLSVARQAAVAVAVVEPQLFHDARHAPGTSVPSHDQARCSRASSSGGRAGAATRSPRGCSCLTGRAARSA